MKKPVLIIGGVAVLALVAAGALYVAGNDAGTPGGGSSSRSSLSSVSSVSSASSDTSLSFINDTSFPLRGPDGFRIEVFAENLPGARVIALDGFGNYWVSRPSAGAVAVLEMADDGTVRQHYDAITGLDHPHGLAFNPAGTELYVAEETVLKKYLVYTDAPVQTIARFPAGGRHTTRTVAWGPDDRLYVSIGSTCDVCVEPNDLHGTIISMNPDGSDQKTVATGLRNAVFFDWSYVDGKMYATEMGRDHLGDDLPPEEVNVIKEGAHYGWPFCYGDRVRDQSFQPGTTFDCITTEPPHLTMPAHIAPLGLAFIPEEGWPEEYWYDLLVAQHGSWNSSDPVGYRIVRIPLDANGNPEGEQEEFIGGWLQNGSSLGRPVDLLIFPGGTLLVTDDKAGVVYRVERVGE